VTLLDRKVDQVIFPAQFASLVAGVLGNLGSFSRSGECFSCGHA